jgi:RNA polymerase sigma-70 factor, ECF subfamily
VKGAVRESTRPQPSPARRAEFFFTGGQVFVGQLSLVAKPPTTEDRLRYTVRAVPASPVAYGSFEELAMPLFSQLYNFACWLAGDRAAAEDLVQETYLKACRGFTSFQQGTNFRAWIYRILRNTFLTSQTGLKATASFDDEDEALAEPAEAHTPESILLARDAQEKIRAALEALPVHHREIILLCDLEEMSYQEISQAMSIPMGTVMSRLSRARRAMRTLLMAAAEGRTR